MATGTVKWFNATKGYGFIRLDEAEKDAFVHVSEVERSGIGRLTEGQRIAFQIKEDARGLRANKLETAEA
jgi:CspA family cold shock protein